MLLYHPGVASIGCDACKKMMHDMTTGKPVVRYRGPKREPYNVTASNSGYFEPCRQPQYKCPKGTPETAHEHELNDRNRRTLLLYRQAKATGFKFVPELDALMADNFAIIDTMMDAHRLDQQADATVGGIGELLTVLRKQ